MGGRGGRREGRLCGRRACLCAISPTRTAHRGGAALVGGGSRGLGGGDRSRCSWKRRVGQVRSRGRIRSRRRRLCYQECRRMRSWVQRATRRRDGSLVGCGNRAALVMVSQGVLGTGSCECTIGCRGQGSVGVVMIPAGRRVKGVLDIVHELEHCYETRS